MELSSPARPVWRVVVTLALPVLMQQMVLLVIQQSDRYLAGHLTMLAPWETGEPAAYQAAQTTAQYLSWFITCYIFLVSVGSTALVAALHRRGRSAACDSYLQSVDPAGSRARLGGEHGWLLGPGHRRPRA